MSDTIRFLGTGGGRVSVANQLRRSGGTLFEVNDTKVLLDPGPGCMVCLADVEPKIDPQSINGAILSHCHIDHSNDVNILIDAMTVGGRRTRGTLFAPADSLRGDGSVVLSYVQPFLSDIIELEPLSSYQVDDFKFQTSARHSHPHETYGLIVSHELGRLGYVVDTKATDDVIDSYSGCDALVMNVVLSESIVLPPGVRGVAPRHLTIESAAAVLEKVRPRRAVITHFGAGVIEMGPERVASDIATRSGIPVIAAEDNMVLTFDQLLE